MARIRYIKPAFFKDVELKKLPYEARIFYAGLWTVADKKGRGLDRPDELKIEIMPYDNIDPELMMDMLARPKERYGRPFIVRYQVNGERYFQVLKWGDHQRPHHTERQSTIPPPPKEVLERLANVALTVRYQEGMGKGMGKGNREKNREPSAADAALKDIKDNYKVNVFQILNQLKQRMRAEKSTMLGPDFRIPDEVILKTCESFKRTKVRRPHPWFLEVLGAELIRWHVDRQDREHEAEKAADVDAPDGETKALKDILAKMPKGGRVA